MNVSCSFSLRSINSMIFNKFNFSDDYIPHDNTLNEPVCDYYFCDSTFNFDVSKNSLKLLAYNISSIPMNLHTFCDQFLDQSNLKFDVIGFCETRLNDTISSLYKIPTYN